MRAAVQGAGPVQTGAGVDPPSYLLAQKRLLNSALVRRARSTTSESRRATRSAGARQLRRVIDATLARSAFAARPALPRFRLHFFGLVAPSACITNPAIRSSTASREQCLHSHAGCGGEFKVARTAPMAHSTPASESSAS